MTRLVVLQPGYLPWLGYFDQVDRADIFVHYDDVQFDKQGWRNRNRIKTPQGPQWLTVPVLHRHKSSQPICEVEIDDRVPWARKHLQAIEQNYAGAPFLEPTLAELAEVLERPWQLLAELDIALSELLCRRLGVAAQFHRASSLGLAGERSERLIAMCRHFGAEGYLSGDAARDYLDLDGFARAGVAVEWQDYRHPSYSQLHGAFESHLSILDLLLNEGPGSLEILRSGRPS